jgi:endonuclease/exonuclease/phosphatase family metal-dependent hydrolase
MMRIATFNLESLDLGPKVRVPLEARAEILRPALARLNADVICLQEINGQRIKGQHERTLAALDLLLSGTRYADYHRASTTGADGLGVADVHNVVTLSRLPILSTRELRHQLMPPLQYLVKTADPASSEPELLRFDRPILIVELDLGSGDRLTVVNLHLRAPLAAAIRGQKAAPFVWKSISGWAEGYFLSAVRRGAQALELRLLMDELLEQDPRRLVAIAGDFNAEDHETPMKITVGAEEDTGNGSLSAKALIILDRAISGDRRWSVLHHGRPQMLDHILASRALYGQFRTIEVHNEALGDEVVGYAKIDRLLGSYHAAVVAEFALDPTLGPGSM